MNAELDEHLDGEAAAGKSNHRNGYSKKTVLTETSKIDIKVPRDREGTFDPKLIARYRRRFPGFDEKIVSMYARGMTVREIEGHLVELYGLEVSPDLWKDRRAIAAELKKVYRAKDADAGQAALEAFDAGPWGKKYPSITQGWRRNWAQVIPFFAFPEAVRRIIYTTNAIESLNAKLRRAIRTRGHFPTDDSAMKTALSRLAPGRRRMENAAARMVRGENQFAIMFEGRFPRA